MMDVPRPIDLDDEDYQKFMKDLRTACDGKSVDGSIIYLKKVGKFLESIEKLIDENDVCSSIWNPLPKEVSKKLLTSQQSYVAYKIKTYHQIEINDNHTLIQTVISLIVDEQISILQTAPLDVTQPVFQRSESATNESNKKTKWW